MLREAVKDFRHELRRATRTHTHTHAHTHTIYIANFYNDDHYTYASTYKTSVSRHLQCQLKWSMLT